MTCRPKNRKKLGLAPETRFQLGTCNSKSWNPESCRVHSFQVYTIQKTTPPSPTPRACTQKRDCSTPHCPKKVPSAYNTWGGCVGSRGSFLPLQGVPRAFLRQSCWSSRSRRSGRTTFPGRTVPAINLTNLLPTRDVATCNQQRKQKVLVTRVHSCSFCQHSSRCLDLIGSAVRLNVERCYSSNLEIKSRIALCGFHKPSP